MVFVLGTRPNDTLRPLELLKPRYEYKLPDLSRADFDLILQHRGVQLSRELADRFYEVMQKNALYLDLVAKELAETRLENPVEVIERVADDPDNIFTLSIERLSELAADLIEARQWQLVEIILPAIELDAWLVKALQGLVSALRQAEEGEAEILWIALQKAIPSLQDSQQRDNLWYELSDVLIQAQQWVRAEAAIKAIDRVVERAYAFCVLSEALVKAQEIANPVWIEAEQATMSISDGREKVEAMKDLGVALAQAQQVEWAKSVWRKAEEAIGKLDDARQRAAAMKDLGVALAQAQQVEWAKSVWRKADSNYPKLMHCRIWQSYCCVRNNGEWAILF